MKKMALLLVWAMIAAMTAPSSLAAQSVYRGPYANDWIKAIDGGDKVAVKLIGAFATGMMIANMRLEVRQQEQLFCPPGQLAITDDQYVSILRQFMLRYPDLGADMPVELMMLKALEKTFPCSDQK